MRTNRDLYKSIERLLEEKQGNSSPSLEAYLSALIVRAQQFAHRESLSLEEFFSLLQDGFDGPGEASPCQPSAGFQKWKVEVEQQIEDLQQMARNGQLDNEYRYSGTSAPSGRYWYNFDPCTYLECGVAGSLGGWVEGDSTGRAYVPGQVAYIAPDGTIGSCDPRDFDRSPTGIPEITWTMFTDFVWCGQNYE